MVIRPWCLLGGWGRQVRSWVARHLTWNQLKRWIGPLGLTVVITVLHFGIDPQHMFWHDLLRRAYYVPIIWAIYLWGFRGGAITSSVIGTVFTLHLLTGWGHHLGDQIDQVYDILGYIAVGFGVGFVVDRARVVAVAVAQREWDISLQGVLSAAIHELKQPREYVRKLADQMSERSELGMWEYAVSSRLVETGDRIDDLRRDLAGIARILSTRSPVVRPFDWAIEFARTAHLGGLFGLIVVRADTDSPPPSIWPIAPAVLDEIARILLENLDAEAGIAGMADLVIGGTAHRLTIECSCQHHPLQGAETARVRHGEAAIRPVRQKLLKLIWSRYCGILQHFEEGPRRGIRLTILRPKVKLNLAGRSAVRSPSAVGPHDTSRPFPEPLADRSPESLSRKSGVPGS